MTLVHGLLILSAYAPSLLRADAAVATSSTMSAVTVNSFTSAAADSAAGVVATTSDSSNPLVTVYHIRCNCSLIYWPVCGSNDVAYSNECEMLCASADNVSNGRPPVQLLHFGKCGTLSCTCPETVHPVCGTNNQTYPNDCYRACVNAYRADNRLPPVDLAYRSICKPNICFCPDAIIPVCSTDIKTYRNICFLQCYSRINVVHGLPLSFVRYRGACKNETCNCSRTENHVCAGDGNTYRNQCALDCRNRRRGQLGLNPLTFEYPGACVKCSCTTKMDPVCGSDGNTYSNYCLLMCEIRVRSRQGLPKLTMRWQGRCDCGCQKKYLPVCASDRNTWSNRCLLNCENKKRTLNGQPRLSAFYEGQCRQCNCDHCPRRYFPVCGSDHNTYQSSCFLKCISKCRVDDGMTPISEIASKKC